MEIVKCLVISSDNVLCQHINNLFRLSPLISLLKNVESITFFHDVFLEFNPHIVVVDVDCIEQEKIKCIVEKYSSFPPIILLSEDSQAAVLAFSLGIATDFIQKPVSLNRLILAINKSLKHHISFSGNANFESIFLKTGRNFTRFKFDDIIYFEASGVYLTLHTESNKFIINDSLSKLEKRFLNFSFTRVHKSFIINTKKIMSFNANYFDLTKGRIPIGPNYKNKIEGLLNMLSKQTVY